MNRDMNPLLKGLLIFGVLASAIVIVFQVIPFKISGEYLLAILSGLGVFIGYYTTHELEMRKEIKIERMKHYLDFAKGLRLFVSESDSKQAAQIENWSNTFQETHFPTSLLISKKGYSKFQELTNVFIAFLSDRGSDRKRKLFRKKQSELINLFREELGSDGDIDFESFDPAEKLRKISDQQFNKVEIDRDKIPEAEVSLEMRSPSKSTKENLDSIPLNI